MSTFLWRGGVILVGIASFVAMYLSARWVRFHVEPFASRMRYHEYTYNYPKVKNRTPRHRPEG